MTKTLFEWQSDTHGGGIATYFKGTEHELITSMPNFNRAWQLQISIEIAIKQAKLHAKQELINIEL